MKAWHGQIPMTPGHLPRIQELETSLFTRMDYDGHLMTTARYLVKPLELNPLQVVKDFSS